MAISTGALQRIGRSGGTGKRAETGEMPGEPPRLARIAHLTLSERVYVELRNALMSGRFVPGESLTIRGVANALGTSVMPVREALQRLAAERALEIVANRSIRVPLKNEESFEELLQMRLMLEGRAAGLAAQRATPAELDQVRRFNHGFDDSPDDDAAAARLFANREFHFAIYRAARSPLLLSLIEMLWLQSGPYLMAPIRWRTTRGEGGSYFAAGVVHHRELIEALAARDSDAAARAVQDDIRDAAQAYRDVLAVRAAEARLGDAG